jgi:DNA polymerase III epsilon subunit-like protein
MGDKILFVDTETTGKALQKLPVRDPRQPHVVQIALLMFEGDTEHLALKTLVRPEGFEIPNDARAIHGISTELATTLGLPVLLVLSLYKALVAKTDWLVGHNIEFDLFVLDCELARLGMDRETKPTFCTMRNATDFTCLPSPYGGWKWPKLAEAHEILLGEPLANAHDAMVDLKATYRLYKWLKDKIAERHLSGVR